jgi:hypothetical protein
MRRSRRVGALAGIAVAVAAMVLIVGCAAKPPRARALIKAREAAGATTNPTYRMSLLTGVGIEWLRLDKREGRAILHDVLSTAEGSDASANARADVVARCAIALAGADPTHAPAILLDGLRRLRRIDPQSDARYSLLAALATRDLNQAVSIAKRLPTGERSLAFAHIARALAPTDLKGATILMTDAVAAPSSPANQRDRWWADVALAAAGRNPTDAVALARNHVSEPRWAARVLFAAVEALTPHDRTAARALVAAEGQPGIQVWGWMALAHASRGEQRQAACEEARRALRDEWAAAMLPKWVGHDLRHLGLQVVRATASRTHTPETVRFSLVAQWSLFAVLESESPSTGYPGPREQAAHYLASAEGWMSRPPRDDELGMVMAAASYVDPLEMLRIYEELLEPASRKHMTAARWFVLSATHHLIARLDLATARRTLGRKPVQFRGVPSAETELVTIAGRLIQMGEPKRAAEWMASAQRALEQRKAEAREYPDDEAIKSRLWESLRWVAIGWAELGKPDEAMRAADEIRDRGKAGETYLTIAQILGGARPPKMDHFEAVRQVATWLDAMAQPNNPVLPWTAAAPADGHRSRLHT